jgi:hypothetical protein
MVRGAIGALRTTGAPATKPAVPSDDHGEGGDEMQDHGAMDMGDER